MVQFPPNTEKISCHLLPTLAPVAPPHNLIMKTKHFSPVAFEHLLFEMHSSVYAGIDQLFCDIEAQHPGLVQEQCDRFQLVFANATTEHVVDKRALGAHLAYDIHIYCPPQDFKRLHKSTQYHTKLQRHDAQDAGKGNHLIVHAQSEKTPTVFMVPLPLVLKPFEALVCAPGTFQSYEHTLIRKKRKEAESKLDYLQGARSYVGITSRSWQLRFREHMNAARRGSMLLFHRALREEFFKIECIEHQVLRAGLKRHAVLRVEEVEVETRTLASIHDFGLNMIPGGEAGIRFLAHMTKRRPAEIDPDRVELELESIVNANLRQPGLSLRGSFSNPKLAELWRDDVAFRIGAMTNRSDRLSYTQVVNARMLHASGFAVEKIHDMLKLMEDRDISLDQVQRLVQGETYSTIPFVLIDLERMREDRKIKTPGKMKNAALARKAA